MAWADLHPDLVREVGKALQAQGGSLEGLLATCRAWKEPLAELVVDLAPLGHGAALHAFPAARRLDYAARGQAHSLTDEQLAEACTTLGPRLVSLSASGAFQLTAAGLEALAACPQLAELALDETTLQDEGLEALGRLPRLAHLSLRRCMFLRGGFLASLAPAAAALKSLDLAGCGLSLHLEAVARSALGALPALEHLDLSGGNGVTDDVLHELARLPRLASLRLRGAAELTDAGLALLAEAPCAGGMHTLDLSFCARLSEHCWGPLSSFSNLRCLVLEGLPHLLCTAPAPEPFASALWRWQKLTSLSLAGSCPHPANLKLITATCGATLTLLDIGAFPARTAGGAVQQPAEGSAALSPWDFFDSGSAGGGGVAAARRQGGCYRRLTPRQLQCLCEGLGALRALRAFRAAGSCLPGEAAAALMRAAPGLEWLDLGQCCLELRRQAPGAASGAAGLAPALPGLPAWQQAGPLLLAPSGAGPAPRAARALNFAEAAPGPSTSLFGMPTASAMAAAAGDEAAAAAAAAEEEFATALGGLRSLQGLSLAGCSGLAGAHLRHLSALGALRLLTLADCRGVDDSALLPCLLPSSAAYSEGQGRCAAEAAPPRLQSLDLSGTAVTDATLVALAAQRELRTLSLARCAVAAGGLAALLGGGSSSGSGSSSAASSSTTSGSGASRSLRGLDISRCSRVDDAALQALSDHCHGLRWLRASGCPAVGQAGVAGLARSMPRLTRLELARCSAAVSDASFSDICHHLTLLTHLDISSADSITTAGLQALSELRCLAHLDLTCCRGVDDDAARALLPQVTRANVQMAGGTYSPTGSPIKRRPAVAAAGVAV